MKLNNSKLLKLLFNVGLAIALTLMVNHYVTAWSEDETLEIRIDNHNPNTFEGVIEIVAKPILPISKEQAFNYQIQTYDDGSQGFNIDLRQLEKGLFNLQASLLNTKGERQKIHLSDSVVLRSGILPNLHFKIHSSNLQTDVLLEEETLAETTGESITEEAALETEVDNGINPEQLELTPATPDNAIDTNTVNSTITTLPVTIIEEKTLPDLKVLEATLNTKNPSLDEDLMVSSVVLNVTDNESEINYQWSVRENTPDFYQKTYLQDVKIKDFWKDLSPNNETYLENPETIEIGFPFNLYTDTFNELSVFKNGLLSFYNQTDKAFDNSTNEKIENSKIWDNRPEALILPLATDENLILSSSSITRTELIGTAPERKRIIEWETKIEATDETLHLQVQLSENSDDILFVYRKIPSSLVYDQIYLGVKDGQMHETKLNDSELILDTIKNSAPVVIMRPGPKFQDIENANSPVLSAAKLSQNKTYRVTITPKATNYKSVPYISPPLTVRPENNNKQNKDETDPENIEEQIDENLFNAEKYHFEKLPDFVFQISFDNKLKINNQDFLLYSEVANIKETFKPNIENDQILLHFPAMKDKYSDYTIGPENLWIDVGKITFQNFLDENGDFYFVLPLQALNNFILYLNLPADTPSGVFDIYGEIATS